MQWILFRQKSVLNRPCTSILLPTPPSFIRCAAIVKRGRGWGMLHLFSQLRRGQRFEHRQCFVCSLDASASPLLPPHIIDWIVEADGLLEWPCLWVYFIINNIFSFQKHKNMAKLTFVSSTTTSAATDTAAATALPLTPFEWFNEEGCSIGKAKEWACLVDLHLFWQKTSCASPSCYLQSALLQLEKGAHNNKPQRLFTIIVQIVKVLAPKPTIHSSCDGYTNK